MCGINLLFVAFEAKMVVWYSRTFLLFSFDVLRIARLMTDVLRQLYSYSFSAERFCCLQHYLSCHERQHAFEAWSRLNIVRPGLDISSNVLYRRPADQRFDITREVWSKLTGLLTK